MTRPLSLPFVGVVLSGIIFCSDDAVANFSVTPKFQETLTFSKTLNGHRHYSFSRSVLSLDSSGLGTHLRDGINLRLETQYQVLVYGGDYLKSSEWTQSVSALSRGRGALELEGSYHRSAKTDFRHRFYRLQAVASRDRWEFSTGRLRNAFGNTRVFVSPLDYFDDLPLVISQPKERLGSDTARLRYHWSPIWRLETAYLWAQRNRDYRAYILAKGLLSQGLEAGLMAGQLGPRSRGAALSADYSWLGGIAGWEASWNKKKEERLVLDLSGGLPVLKIQSEERSFSRQVVRWNRSYAGDWVLGLEYLHNGLGEKKPERYDFSRLLAGREIYLARDYLGASLSRTFSALWFGSAEGIANLKDGTFGWFPEAGYLSAGASLEAKVRWSYFSGPKEGELARLPNRFQIFGAWYF